MIVFDTETTGLPIPEAAPLSKQPHIIEFAAIKLRDDDLEEVGRLEFLAKPPVQLADKITEITGLTDAKLADEKPFAAHFKKLADFFLGERFMIAHHVIFDRDMLRFELLRLDKLLQFPWPPNPLCTVELSHSIKGRRMKMGELHEHAVGFEFKDAHRAMPDVEALVRVVRWMREKHQWL